MYKNLNCELLGISGRQSEIIELALTYGFRGIDIEISDLVKRCERSSFEKAARFLSSSRLRIGGFEIPIDLDGDDGSFARQLEELSAVAEIASRAEAKVGILGIPNQTDRLPYHEYFDVIRQRIQQVSEKLAVEDIRAALNFDPVRSGDAKQFKFVADAEGWVALAKSCKNAGVVFDSWAWHCGNGTRELFEQIADRVSVVRLGDCAAGAEPARARDEDCLLPGSTGVIDNAEFLQRLLDCGLDLPVAARGRMPESNGTRDALISKTQELLNSIFDQVGIASERRRPETFTEASFAGN